MKQEDAQKIMQHIRVAKQEEIDQASFHVCGITQNMPGCQETTCALCGKKIYYSEDRPNLKKACMECVMPLIKDDPNPEIITSSTGLKAMLDILLGHDSNRQN